MTKSIRFFKKFLAKKNRSTKIQNQKEFVKKKKKKKERKISAHWCVALLQFCVEYSFLAKTVNHRKNKKNQEQFSKIPVKIISEIFTFIITKLLSTRRLPT